MQLTQPPVNLSRKPHGKSCYGDLFMQQAPLVKYFIDNSLLRHHQSAYLKTALHKFIDDVLLNINKGKNTGACQIDLTKGFDSINHDVLLYTLQCYCNISLNRSHPIYISVNKLYLGMLPEKENVTISVPQGTILDPIVYLCE